MTGAALYLAICARPDIMFFVCMIARLWLHFWVFHICFICVSGLCEVGISYAEKVMGDASFEFQLDLCELSDLDWASCLPTQRSTSGPPKPITKKSNLLGIKIDDHYSCFINESRIYECILFRPNVAYIHGLLSEIGLGLERPTLFFMDSMVATVFSTLRTLHIMQEPYM